MQVNKQNIKRPSLIEPFFNEELTPSNEFLIYIDCTTKSSNAVHKKNVTPDSHNIKKSLKNITYEDFSSLLKKANKSVLNQILLVCFGSKVLSNKHIIYIEIQNNLASLYQSQNHTRIDSVNTSIFKILSAVT